MSTYLTHTLEGTGLREDYVFSKKMLDMAGRTTVLMITPLFCFASNIIRIYWRERLSMTRICRMNSMNKKQIWFLMTLKHPCPCNFWRGTSLNCKP
jgi:hypothetical protein